MCKRIINKINRIPINLVPFIKEKRQLFIIKLNEEKKKKREIIYIIICVFFRQIIVNLYFFISRVFRKFSLSTRQTYVILYDVYCKIVDCDGCTISKLLI